MTIRSVEFMEELARLALEKQPLRRIARALNVSHETVRRYLIRARFPRLSHAEGIAIAKTYQRPRVRWGMNNGPRLCDSEALAINPAALKTPDKSSPRARLPPPSKPVEIPRWVPADLAAEYRAIAEFDGEETAASIIRRRKQENKITYFT